MQKAITKFRTIAVEVYDCQRCQGEIWLQRPMVKDGHIRKSRPKNCTHCKSPSWNVPRG